MAINSLTSRGITLGATTEIALPVLPGTESVILSVPAGNAAPGVTIGPTGVGAPGADAFHLFPGQTIALDMANAQKVFVRGAATDKVYVLAGNLS